MRIPFQSRTTGGAAGTSGTIIDHAISPFATAVHSIYESNKTCGDKDTNKQGTAKAESRLAFFANVVVGSSVVNFLNADHAVNH